MYMWILENNLTFFEHIGKVSLWIKLILIMQSTLAATNLMICVILTWMFEE